MRIELAGVTVKYDEGLPTATTALGGVDLTLTEGECVGVIGPTGSGKTTLLEVAAGLTGPTDGTARVRAEGEEPRLRDVVGLAYQFPELQFFEETVFDDVAFGPRRQGMGEQQVRERVRDALERSRLDLSDFGGRAPLSLSAGEKRRTAIAGILALGRPFLLLDEPTAGLDPPTADGIADLIMGEVERGCGVVVVSHDLEFVERVAPRTVLMGDGAVLADAPAGDVFSDGHSLERLGLEPPPRYVLIDRLARLSPETARGVAGALAVPERSRDALAAGASLRPGGPGDRVV